MLYLLQLHRLAFYFQIRRKQEYEADHYGLIFAAMAGYNPQEAIPFWERMAKQVEVLQHLKF